MVVRVRIGRMLSVKYSWGTNAVTVYIKEDMRLTPALALLLFAQVVLLDQVAKGEKDESLINTAKERIIMLEHYRKAYSHLVGEIDKALTILDSDNLLEVGKARDILHKALLDMEDYIIDNMGDETEEKKEE